VLSSYLAPAIIAPSTALLVKIKNPSKGPLIKKRPGQGISVERYNWSRLAAVLDISSADNIVKRIRKQNTTKDPNKYMLMKEVELDKLPII
jgi:hypothetical protein